MKNYLNLIKSVAINHARQWSKSGAYQSASAAD
jgi:hypothetical protein